MQIQCTNAMIGVVNKHDLWRNMNSKTAQKKNLQNGLYFKLTIILLSMVEFTAYNWYVNGCLSCNDASEIDYYSFVLLTV